MEDYKRLVSYMYNYENGVKGRNVGYARVESANSKCKVTINIKSSSIKNDELKVLFFKRNGYSIEEVEIGTLAVKNGLGKFRMITDSNNIMDSSYEIEDMGGLILYYDEKKYFATEWDDKPVTKEMVNAALSMDDEVDEIIETNNTDLEVEISTSDNIEEREEKLEVVETEEEIDEVIATEGVEEKIEDEERKEEEERDEVVDERIEIEEVAEKIGIEETNKIEEEIEDYTKSFEEARLGAKEQTRKQRKKFEEDPEALKIYNKYPKMYPFEDNEVAWCVRFEPQDIGLLPMENWSLGNNSFLLHGFYCYSHLIFARINDKNGIQYILGVPGIYHNREKFMAKMFGFEFFKSIKRKELRTGEFGYWYTPIHFS